MKTLITVTLMLCAATTAAQERGAVVTSAREHELVRDFQKYKRDTLELLDRHFKGHPECALRRVRPTIERMLIVAEWREEPILAWTFPTWKDYDDRHMPLVYVNSRVCWDARRAARVLIHEALHLTVDERGDFTCGPDRKPSARRICVALGVDVHRSRDIDRAIEAHLKEIKEFEGERWRE